MSDNKITQDQLEPNVMEELESGIGDLSTLSTENKDSLVAAVTEIYGKSIIADAIGEPLAVTDTFSEMGSEINSLLSSFKTNMMNSGVTVESGDKFKQLIEKIKGLTEGEGNKGVQYAEGSLPDVIFNDNDVREHVEYPMEYNIDFVPSILIIRAGKVTSTVGTSVSEYNVDAVAISNLNNSSTSTISVVFTDNYNAINFGTCYINENNNLMFYSPYSINNSRDSVILSEITYYAIGVGEEDTTLRDSLASILEEEGVSVTEEDDMASLITKVDEEFDRLNPSKHIVQIETSASGTNTFIVKNDGSLWACGYNYNGELGLGNEDIVRTLTQVTTNINNDVKEVSCGAVTAMLLKNDGTLWVCGKDSYGSLAIPDVDETSTFIQVPDMYDVKHIISGYYFTLAIKNDGSLWACGSNGQGQLGLGDTDGRSTFTQVTTNINYDVKEFYCSNINNENTVFIVKNDGSVWGSGYNAYGRLGTGDTTNKNVFTQII